MSQNKKICIKVENKINWLSSLKFNTFVKVLLNGVYIRKKWVIKLQRSGKVEIIYNDMKNTYKLYPVKLKNLSQAIRYFNKVAGTKSTPQNQ